MISMLGYWMGRDKVYASEFTAQIRGNGEVTVSAINKILGQFAADTGIVLTEVASGWRPVAVNCATSNAADHSRHILAEAGDVCDTPNRDLARWCAKNQAKLADWGLWCERFEWTPTWVHFQRVPPVSKKRFYIPSTAPALVARLPEQDQFNC
jgi:hypothetical protein